MAVGVLLAVGATMGYTCTTLFLTLLKKKAGPVSTKYIFTFAFIANTLLHIVVFGAVFPKGMSIMHIGFLGISAVLGYVVGFFFMIKALQLIGPRLVLLVVVSTAVFSFFLGWIFLGETQTVISLLYVALVLAGILIVILFTTETGGAISDVEKNRPADRRSVLWLGVLFSVVVSFCQAVGLLFSKLVLLTGVTPISVNSYRLMFASGSMIIVTLFAGSRGEISFKSFAKRDWILIGTASVVGPVLGNALLFFSLEYISIGVSTAMMQLSPIFMLFISRILYKERIRPSAVGGTIIAVVGTVLLALR